MTTSCTYPVIEGIAVQTDTPEIKRARRLVMELLLPLAPDAPKIKALAHELGVTGPRFSSEGDNCIKCGLCVRACDELVGAYAITFAQRGVTRTVEPPFEEETENCIGCGTCVQICPTGCISMEDRGMERKIDKWKRTLEMKACTKCGRPFISLAEITFIQGKAKNPPPAEWFDNCPDCR
jgi:NADH dehydrogenase/NADH:ubiquinone oxidoreductase subunit G